MYDWEIIKTQEVVSYVPVDEEPATLHIMKSGVVGAYLVIFEDPNSSSATQLSAQQIEKIHGIKIDL